MSFMHDMAFILPARIPFFGAVAAQTGYPISPYILWPLAIGVIVLILAIVFLYERRTLQIWTRLAHALKYEFEEWGSNLNLPSTFYLTRRVRRHTEERIGPMVSGMLGEAEVAVFKYGLYSEDQHGSNLVAYPEAVVCIRSPALNLPSFTMRPKNRIWGLIASRLKPEPVFEKIPQLNLFYRLDGKERPSLGRLFTREILRFYAGHRGRITEGKGNVMIHYIPHNRWKLTGWRTDQLQRLFEEAKLLYSQLKDAQNAIR